MRKVLSVSEVVELLSTFASLYLFSHYLSPQVLTKLASGRSMWSFPMVIHTNPHLSVLWTACTTQMWMRRECPTGVHAFLTVFTWTPVNWSFKTHPYSSGSVCLDVINQTWSPMFGKSVVTSYVLFTRWHEASPKRTLFCLPSFQTLSTSLRFSCLNWSSTQTPLTLWMARRHRCLWETRSCTSRGSEVGVIFFHLHHAGWKLPITTKFDSRLLVVVL